VSYLNAELKDFNEDQSQFNAKPASVCSELEFQIHSDSLNTNSELRANILAAAKTIRQLTSPGEDRNETHGCVRYFASTLTDARKVTHPFTAKPSHVRSLLGDCTKQFSRRRVTQSLNNKKSTNTEYIQKAAWVFEWAPKHTNTHEYNDHTPGALLGTLQIAREERQHSTNVEWDKSSNNVRGHHRHTIGTGIKTDFTVEGDIDLDVHGLIIQQGAFIVRHSVRLSRSRKRACENQNSFEVALEVELEIDWDKVYCTTHHGKLIPDEIVSNVLYSVVSVFSDLLHVWS
jgi:hypothetical protein